MSTSTAMAPRLTTLVAAQEKKCRMTAGPPSRACPVHSLGLGSCQCVSRADSGLPVVRLEIADARFSSLPLPELVKLRT